MDISDEPTTSGSVGRLLPRLEKGEFCIPLNLNLPHGDPMRRILNAAFRREG